MEDAQAAATAKPRFGTLGPRGVYGEATIAYDAYGGKICLYDKGSGQPEDESTAADAPVRQKYFVAY